MPSDHAVLKATVMLIVFFTSTFSFALQSQEKTILFVCEHGSAKSVVAAAHFRRMAEQEGMAVEVISRGTKPDKIVPEKINHFLNEDGLPGCDAQPVLLTNDDLRNADYIIIFSPLPPSYASSANIELWNVPAIDAGYPAARDSIVVNIAKIIQRIKSEKRK